MELGLDSYEDEVNSELAEITADFEVEGLAESIRHITLSGGKRVRPILTLLCFEMTDKGKGDREKALRYAAGVELVHTSALVADDIIDRAEVRRGVESVHERYGKDDAVITSNMLLGRALELIEDKRAVECMIEAVDSLGKGEAMELEGVIDSVDESLDLAYRKTAALFIASCVLGGLATDVGEGELDSLRAYGKHLGIGFQIRDDILDYTSTQEDLGKPVGKDALLERPSLVAVHSRETDSRLMDSVEFARGEARNRAEKARDAISGFPEGDAKQRLTAITDFVVTRSK